MRRFFFISLIFCWVFTDLVTTIAVSPWLVETVSQELLEEVDPKAKEEQTVAARQSFVAASLESTASEVPPVLFRARPIKAHFHHPGLHILHRTFLI
jgi:hypothetical protein